MKRAFMPLLVVALAVSLAALTGCQQLAQQAANKAIEKATGAKIQNNGGSMSIETSQGSANISQGGSLPEGFPTDVPVYKPSTVTGSVSGGKTSADRTYVVSLDSTDAKQTVYDWYVNELGSNGWSITNKVAATTGSGAVTATKDSLQVLATVSDGSGTVATKITLTVTPKTTQ